jgi:hypothetical protein
MSEKKSNPFELMEITVNGKGISFALEIFKENCPKLFFYHKPSKLPKIWSPNNGRGRTSKVRKIDPATLKITILL